MNATGGYELKLTPVKTVNSIEAVFITVSRETFEIIRVVTLNAYGDETSLTFEDMKFNHELDDGLFEFSPPEGTERLSLEE